MKKNKYLFTTLILVISFITFTSIAFAKENKKPRVENQIDTETKRGSPIVTKISNMSISTLTASASTDTFGPNLISNPSFTTASSTSIPANWNKGGYGSNTRTFTYPINGNTDSKAVKVSLSNYISGDAKWYFNEVSVQPNTSYQFTDYSLSNTQSIITARFKLLNGSYVYKDILIVPPSNVYYKNTVRIITPANTVSITIFHLINSNGFLSVDDFSLNLVTSANNKNMVQNGDFESIGIDGLPIGWIKGGWGTNVKSYNYPLTGISNSTSANVVISNFTSGDAKWYFKPISITPGIYTYSDQILSDVPSTITAQLYNVDGSISFKDLLKIPVAASLTASSVDFSVGSEVSKITVFHLIQSKGTLNIDNVLIEKKSNPVGIFTTGAVTLRFDDGWLSEYENAIPKMNSAGIKGTFYIVTNQKSDDGFPAFMSTTQIKDVYNMGHEIGAHTRTHPLLTTLSTTDQQNEIIGSRNDLLAMNVGPILSFAYPYGDYNTNTLAIVESAGFTNAISTIDGYGTQTSEKFQIERKGVVISTTLAEIKKWIDEAQTQKKWLILTFHEVNDSGAQYSITPSNFGEIVDYIISKKIPVVTATEGALSVQ